MELDQKNFIKNYITASIYMTGMSIMTLEICASRLVAPYFGNSVFVWGALISTAMIFLTLGYRLGGQWADNSPDLKTYGRMLLTASSYIVPMAFLSASVQEFLMKSLPFQPALILSIIFILGIPCIFLGGASPYAIRLMMDRVDNSGSIMGSLFGMQTLGGVTGALLPPLVGIPHAGTAWTVGIAGIILFLTAAVALGINRWTLAGAALILASMAIPVIGQEKDPSILSRFETPYGIYTVRESPDGTRALMVNGNRFAYSVWKPRGVMLGINWDACVLAPYFLPAEKSVKVKKILMLGLAGGSSIGMYDRLRPGFEFDGVDIDRALVETGKKYFYLNMPNLTIHLMDARRFLHLSEKKYDVILINLYIGHQVPSHLITREFFQLVRSRLTPDGIIAANIPPSLLPQACATMGPLFSQGLIIDNVYFFSNSPDFSLMNLIDNLDGIPDTETSNYAKSLIKDKNRIITKIKTDGPVLTDDRSPNSF